MEDVAPKLADELLSAYKKAISKVLNKYEKYIKQGSVSYETAHNFSLEAYDIAFNAVKKTLTPDALPDERLYFNIAERTLKPLIEQGCNDIADYCKQIQKNMNDSLGAHIKAADVPLEADRIHDIVSHAANIEKFDEVVDKIGYSMENLYQHVVDESIRRNADMHYKLGFKPKIIRIAESKCCKWCSNLEGTYDYADVSNKGNDVFRRHRNCRCTVLYEEKKGDKYEVTNVHTKKTTVELSGYEDFMGQKKNYEFYKTIPKKSVIGNDKLEKVVITTYQNSKYQNIYNQTNSKDSQEISKYLDKEINQKNRFGKLNQIIVCKNSTLGGIAAYDYKNNALFISEELNDKNKFKKIVNNTSHLAENVDEVLVHELGGHKKHWDSIYKMHEISNLEIDVCKDRLEADLRLYVKNQMHNDIMYLKRVVSNNSFIDFDTKRSLNETIADVAILRNRNHVTDSVLYEFIEEIFNYDG